MIFKPDWVYWRPALITMLMALLFSVMIKLLGIYYYREIDNQYEKKNTVYKKLITDFNLLQERNKDIATFGKAFSELEKSGIFDGKERVKWVDTVNSVRHKIKLPLVRYKISQQEPFSAPYLPADNSVSVMSSKIMLDIGLLHEDDLVSLFDWMDRHVQGQLYLSQCELIRTSPVFGYAPDRPNISAACVLNWLTITPAQEVTTNAQ